MSDEIDQANDQVAMNEARSIAYARVEASKPIPTSETCLWCAAKTKDGRRFCNRDCCSQWEKYGGQ